MLLLRSRALLQRRSLFPFKPLHRNLCVYAAHRRITMQHDPPVVNDGNEPKGERESFRWREEDCLASEKVATEAVVLTLGSQPTSGDFFDEAESKHGRANETGKRIDEGPDESPQLSLEKQIVMELVLDGVSLFIGGEAGTGKSFLLRYMKRKLEAMNLHVALTASTGIAALGVGGNTFHSAFGVPVFSQDEKCDSMASHIVSQVSYDVDSLTDKDVIIIDEVSLMHAGYIEALDLAARAAPGKAPHLPFGGIQVILVGDFMQLMHENISDKVDHDRIICNGVEKNDLSPETAMMDRKGQGEAFLAGAVDGARQQSIRRGNTLPSLGTQRRQLQFYHGRPLFESPVFQHCLLHLWLRDVIRQGEDPEFLECLRKLRRGVLTYRLARSAALNTEDPNAIRLFPRKREVMAFNNAKMFELDGEERCFRTRFQMKRCVGPDLTADVAGSREERRYSNILVIHFRSKPLHSKKWRRLAEELVHRLASEHKLRDVMQIVMPAVPSPYRRHLCVYVRFRDGAGEEGVNAMTKLQSAFRGKFSSKGRTVTAAQKFWGVVSLEVRPGDYVERLFRSLSERKYSKMIQNDHVLQHKRLKVGCRVMLLRNLNKDYVNGSLGTIVSFQPLHRVRHLLPTDLKVMLSRRAYNSLRKQDQKQRHQQPSSTEAPLETLDRGCKHSDMSDNKEEKRHNTTGCDDGDDGNDSDDRHCDGETIIPVVRMDSNGKEVAIPWVSMPFPAWRHHDVCDDVRVVAMPLIPAYAYTVHKVQGLTFDTPILFDGKGFFPCNHIIYVAASRVKHFSLFRMVNVSPDMVMVHRGALQFSLSIPSAAEALKTWEKWKREQKAKCPPQHHHHVESTSSPHELHLCFASWKQRIFFRR